MDRPPGDGYGRVRTQRLFIAVALPPDVCRAVEGLVDGVRDAVRVAAGPEAHPVRWVRLDGLHLTLRFLGPTTPERLEAVTSAARQAAAAGRPVEVSIAGAGAFPSVAHPRVLWLGIAIGASALGELADDLEARLVAAGWPPEGRPFRPHLTLARADGIRQGPRTAALLADAAASFEARWTADRLTLFESHVGGGPARYEPLLEVALGDPA
jgi:2'-5' RNA ligase